MTHDDGAAGAELLARAASYLGNGGFFNPELMDHDKVRDLVMDLSVALRSALRAPQIEIEQWKTNSRENKLIAEENSRRADRAEAELAALRAPQGPNVGELEVIVNGQPVSVQAGKVRDVIAQAIRLSGQIGAPIAQWQLRTTEGDVIPHELTDGTDYELTPGHRLWLNLGLPVALRAPRFDPTNHHNALVCPYCNPKGLTFQEPVALRAPQPQEDDERRCAVCGWTLATNHELGCVRGSCLQRPFPDRFYAPERAASEYGQDLTRFDKAAALRAPQEGKP